MIRGTCFHFLSNESRRQNKNLHYSRLIGRAGVGLLWCIFSNTKSMQQFSGTKPEIFN